MLNRTTADIASATIRLRHFGGRPLDELAADMPLLPVDAPGLAPPGPSFWRMAAALTPADPDAPPAEPDEAKPKKKKKKADPAAAARLAPVLTAHVRTAMYQDGLSVRTDVLGEARGVDYYPGVLATDRPDDDLFGPRPCRLVVVGKCPGSHEVVKCRPFVGPSSKPLWDAWAEAGLPPVSREHPVYLTNLVRFAPPAAALSRLPREWVADGLHFVHQEIALCRPEAVLVLGADALKALLGQKAKTADYVGRTGRLELDCRASSDEPPDVHACALFAAEHPAAVARDPDKHPALVAALARVARHLGYAEAARGVPLDHQAVHTLAELRQAVLETERATAGGGAVAFDCEWDGRHPCEPGAYLYTVQWSHAPGHARVVFLRRQGGAANPALPADKAAGWLRRLLADAPARGARLVGHFAKADLPWLESVGVDLYPHFVGADADPADAPRPLDAAYKSYFEGGFDTYVALQSVEESAPRKLEVAGAALVGTERYDTPLHEWLAEYCRTRKIAKRDLSGYGCVPEEVLWTYAAWDADLALRLYYRLNGDPRAGTAGLLDCDRYGLSARRAFALRMRSWGAWAEMERYGLAVDRHAHRALRQVLVARRAELLERLRREAAWPDFDPARRRHRVEFLFGEEHLDCPSQRPAGALSLYLTPYKATDKGGGGRLWEEAQAWCARNEATPAPAVDKESLIHLARGHALADVLRDIDFLSTAMKIMFREPVAAGTPEPVVGDEDDAPPAAPDEERHDRGFMAAVHADGRVRSMFGLVETGRYSSSKPNLMNLTASVDEQYDRLLAWGPHAPKDSPEAKMAFVSRAVVVARPGWYLVSADLKGAEIAAAGWGSGDKLLIEHAERANLDKAHPDYLDLHADLAVRAFGLKCSMKEVKELYPHLRTAAKRVRFGHYYGASPETIHRQILTETSEVTLKQVIKMVEGHDKAYPRLAAFFEACRNRVATHGWMRNGFGGTRRFRAASDRDLLAAQGREAQNWSCQGLVADAISLALGNVWYTLRARGMAARVVLSVHDSIMLEVPPAELAYAADVLLPEAMGRNCPVVPTDLDGKPVKGRGPYHFGVDVSVYRSWGVEVPEACWRSECPAA